MTKHSIKTDGDCINNLVSKLNKKIGQETTTQLKQTAINVVQKSVDVYAKNFGDGDVGAEGNGCVNNPYQGSDPIPTGTTGLIYGQVQSGKTNATIATLAIAHANQFRCFIVLTSNNTWLGQQTSTRFNEQLQRGPVVFNWKQWQQDPQDFAQRKLKPYLEDTGVVLVSTKQGNHLERLLEILQLAEVKKFPTLIFDDEADNVSLNTNLAKQAQKSNKNISDSATFEKIGKIRKEVANHIYLQITATPQSLLLQNLNHPCKPAFCAALPKPGNSYMGGNLFFSEQSPYCCVVNAEDLEELKKPKGKNNLENAKIPEGLRLALCCFFLGAVYKIYDNHSDEDGQYYSFLAHISHKKINHDYQEKLISDFVIELDQAIRGRLSDTKKQEAISWLYEAYQELRKTAQLTPFDELVENLKKEMRSVIPQVINANNSDKEPKYNRGMNILIGGNRLGRGVTIEGLMVTYYGRDAKQKLMDTVHQHARMYGYRAKLKDVTRLFLAEHILEDFRAIHEADEEMRQAIGDDLDNIELQPVWVGPKLKPTRSNVLNPATIDVFKPGAATFPRDPLWKASEIREHTERLQQLLADFQKEDNHPYKVKIDFLLKLLEQMPSRPCLGYNWEDQRVRQALKAIKSNGIEEGILYVRRGKAKQGLDLSNQLTRPWLGSGFAQSQWINMSKNEDPSLPKLIVMYEKGDKQKHWDNQPLFLPTLIMPKSKFVFMFNYFDEPDKLENGLVVESEYDLELTEIEDIDDNEWLRAAANNSAFNFLKDPEEDIYTLADSKPFYD